jgi:aromatic ring-opening dioxygenase catalytic subunit (LigB family)
MGEVVGAGLVAHVPTIMLPEEIRRELNRGEDFSLVGGLEQLRADVFEKVDYDTVVVLDSHWFTTVEFVVTAQERRSGLFTSEELPRGMKQIPFDWLGDPELAWAMDRYSADHATWVTAIDDEYLPVFYATVNLWKYLGEGLDKRWISVSVAQTGVTEDFLRAGRALGQAIEASDRKVMLVASGALSHTFWKLRELRDHEAADLSSIRTPEARAADEERIAWLKEGNHAKVLETMDEFLKYRPESMFAHYLMMLGAVGEEKCTAPARQYGEYENSIGTGQVHLWCDRPDDGFPRQNLTPTDPEFLRQQSGPDIPAAG